MEYLKKFVFAHYLSLLITGLLLFMAIWAGFVIRVIGSREMANTVYVVVTTKDNHKLANRPLDKQAHSGNIAPMDPDPARVNSWRVPNVFISKIFFILEKNEIKNIDSVLITIGEKSFSYKGADLASWSVEEAEKNSPYLEAYSKTQVIFQAPVGVTGEASRLPLFSRVFGKVIINWAGDSKLVTQPLLSAAKLFALLAVSVFLYFFLILNFFPGAFGQSSPLEREPAITFIAFNLALLFTAAALILFCAAVKLFYKPDINLILIRVRQVYLPQLLPSFVPKPVERAQFVFSVLLSPFLLWGFYKQAASFLAKKSQTILLNLYNFLRYFDAVFLFGLVFCGLCMANFLYVQNAYFMLPFGKFIYALLAFPIMLWLTFAGQARPLFKRAVAILPYLFIALILTAVFLLNIFNYNYTAGTFNYDNILYPLAQVAGGKTLFVGSGSYYGLFPIFLSPIFRLVGPSVLKFTVMFALLLAGSYLALFVVLKNVVREKLVLLGGICSVFYFAYFSTFIVYYAYWPVRFFPACVLILLVWYFVKGSSRIFYYLGFIWCCISVLWNLETGLVMMVAWALLLGYDEICKSKGKDLVKSLAKHLAVLVGFLCLTGVLFALYTHLRSGAYPDWQFFYKYQKLNIDGFFLIPMLPPPHIWSLLILTYLAGLLYSLRTLFQQATPKAKLIFFLSILGFGLFAYYEGRSNDWALPAPAFPAVLLFTLFADELLYLAKKNIRPLENIGVLLLLLFALYSAPVSLLAEAPQIALRIKSNLQLIRAKNLPIEKNIEFIKENSRPGEKVFIVSQEYESIYYTETGTVSAPDLPSSSDFFTIEDVAEINAFLSRNVSAKIFYEPGNPLRADPEATEILKNDYRVSATSGGMELLLKK